MTTGTIRTRIERLEHKRRLAGQPCPGCARGVGLAVVIDRPGQPIRTIGNRACDSCGRLGLPLVIRIRQESGPADDPQKAG